MIIRIIAIFILLSSVSFLLLARFYSPLRRSLFGGEFSISFDEIQFWAKKVPQRNYYKVYARYLKRFKTEDSEFGHEIYFDDEAQGGGWIIMFNPEDDKIYGSGWIEVRENNNREWKQAFYYLGEGKIEGKVFKPIFLEGAKFIFFQGGSLEITSAPREFLKIYFVGTLKKLEKEELEKNSIREIVEDVTRVKRN